MGGGGGPAGWGGAIAVVPYEMYKIYGDRELISPKQFAAICNAMAIRRFGLKAIEPAEKKEECEP